LFCLSHILETEKESKTGWVTNNPSSSHIKLSSFDILNPTEIAGEVIPPAEIICILCTPKAVEIRDGTR